MHMGCTWDASLPEALSRWIGFVLFGGDCANHEQRPQQALHQPPVGGVIVQYPAEEHQSASATGFYGSIRSQ